MHDGKPASDAVGGGTGRRSLMRRLGLADSALPACGGWYPDDQVLEAAFDRIARRPCRRIAVLGGGPAAAVLARGLGARGTVWLVEHDPRAIEICAQMVEAIAPDADMRIIEAELQDHSRHALWYDRHAVGALPDALDLIFIAGPPHFCGRTPCYPAGPELFHKLSSGGAVVLDKASRAREKKTLARWAGEFPHLAQRRMKGGAVLLAAD